MRLTLCLFLNCIYLTISTVPLVTLPQGKILGVRSETPEKKTYYSFEKIPYAAPPVGKLRFQAPQPPRNWDDILNCTILDVACHQPNKDFKTLSEDCLYLNVFTPQLLGAETNISLPVMFYIHGGGFFEGSSIIYNDQSFVNYNVILVTINYRLGPLGFLSTSDSTIPGNNRLKDQHLALKWVQTHISLFGGDPNRVTIFGHSAGSASVGYHILSPKSKSLFWAAICQSGSVLAPWAYQRDARKNAFKMASFLNESFTRNNNSEDLLEFLQNVPVEDINRAAKLYRIYRFGNRSEDYSSLEGKFWSPTLETHDDAFLAESMYKSLQNGNFNKVPLLTGFTTEENLNFHIDREEARLTMKSYDKNITDLIPIDLEVSNSTQVAQIIKEMYTNGKNFSDHIGSGIRFSSDNDMTRPIMKQTELYSKFSETYFYVFSYKEASSYLNISYEGAGQVGHAAELFYLFPFEKKYSKKDLLLKKRLLKIWTNFAKFRNPTWKPEILLQNVLWPQVKTENDFPYVEIGETLEIKNFPKWDVYLKWKQLYKEFGSKDLITY